MAASTDHPQHQHGQVHIDEAGWQALTAQTEQQGELLLPFVTDPIGIHRRPDISIEASREITIVRAIGGL